MKCTRCGEYIYKGRKFNARKETTEEKYYAITIYRFYIRCTRCSGEITFKTDPKNMDYACENGAKRNFEPWRTAGGEEESEMERLDRLEREEEERDAMLELETKTLDAKTEMQISDALDEIRTRNARIERADKEDGVVGVLEDKDEERLRLEREDEEAARAAFMKNVDDMEVVDEEVIDKDGSSSKLLMIEEEAPLIIPSFGRTKKTKKASLLGIKKKGPLV